MKSKLFQLKNIIVFKRKLFFLPHHIKRNEYSIKKMSAYLADQLLLERINISTENKMQLKIKL